MSAPGLMAFWADIDTDYLLRFQEWHNCEHIPERVSIPGFREGRRYRLREREAAFLMMYDTDSTAVLSSEPYLDALNAPTPWTGEALRHFRSPVRNIYELVFAAGAAGDFAAPWIASLRFNAPDVPRAWLRRTTDAPGVTRARLFSIDEQTSNIMTSERGVYGGGPGEQQHLALVETSTPEAAETAWRSLPDTLEDAYADHGWLEMAHERRST